MDLRILRNWPSSLPKRINIINNNFYSLLYTLSQGHRLTHSLYCIHSCIIKCIQCGNAHLNLTRTCKLTLFPLMRYVVCIVYTIRIRALQFFKFSCILYSCIYNKPLTIDISCIHNLFLQYRYLSCIEFWVNFFIFMYFV